MWEFIVCWELGEVNLLRPEGGRGAAFLGVGPRAGRVGRDEDVNFDY